MALQRRPYKLGKAMAQENERRAAYRCSIPPENSSARLKIGSRRYMVSVLDTSREGYSLKVPTKVAKRIPESNLFQIEFAGETWEVSKMGSYTESPNYSHVGVRRFREITKLKAEVGGFNWWFLPKAALDKDPVMLAGLVGAFLLACICLPGVGDHLGTAPRINRAVKSAWSSFEKSVLP